MGFPHSWESFFQVVAGLGIVLLSVLIAIDKRLMRKAKAEKRVKKLREKAISSGEPLISYPIEESMVNDEDNESSVS